MSIQLDATTPVKITAKATDKEGNLVDVAVGEITLTAETLTGEFGEMNDANDTFNPGTAGSTGIIRATTVVDGMNLEAEVEVMLVPGAPSTLNLAFAPEV